MDYEDILDQSDEEANGRMLATKILDLMDKLRLSNNQQAAKRWIWELLQNAKDVAFEDAGVSVSIELQDRGKQSFLEFKHNGKPFTAKTITFLIRQVSTKDRSQKDGKHVTTGKFGTGFLSTHLLSETVRVRGIVKDDNLPHRQFDLLLDRSPTEIDDVIISVENSLKGIRRALSPSVKPVAYDAADYNTNFSYPLSPSKIKVAQAGIADLHHSLPYTLAFSPQIRSVAVLHDGITYQLDGLPQKLSNVFELVTIKELQHGKTATQTQIIVARGQKAAVAVEGKIDDKGIVYIAKIPVDQPRLFCDFPLIGSHAFPFPVVVNSSHFNPNEPRSAIWLTDVEDSRVKENEEIMKEAMSLYAQLLQRASEKKWADVYNLVDIPPVISSEWLDRDWYEDNILYPLRYTIGHTALVENLPSKTRIAMFDEDDAPLVRFPFGPNKEASEAIWKLANGWIPSQLPPLADIHHWQRVIWPDCDRISLENLATLIEESEDLLTLANMLGKTVDKTRSWLNEFYSALDLDHAFRTRVVNGEFSVIPNQNDSFKARPALLIQEDVDEHLKDVLKLLGEDIRDKLVRPDAFTGDIEYTIFDQQELIDQINTTLQNSKIDSQLKYQACDYIVTLFSDDSEFPLPRRQNIYDFSKLFYPDTVGEKRQLEYYHPDIFKEADKIQVRLIVQHVHKQETIAQLAEHLDFADGKETLIWLNSLVDFLLQNDFESQLELKNTPILPNQNGVFTPKNNLNLDDGEIPNALKDIAAALGTDFREKLLDTAIFLELPDNRVTSADQVADEIIRLITPRLAEIKRSDETRTIFRQLYQYFLSDPDKAAHLFPDLYKNKHMLFGAEEIASSIAKGEEVDQLLREYAIDDIPALRSLLARQLREQATAPHEEEIISKETLAALGISSEEQLKKLIGEDPTSAVFRHNPTSTPEMFHYANSIIARTRENVIAHLKTLPDYGFDEDDLDDIAPTVLGGIRKQGLPVHIVFRPSDNGQVLFYYPSEKATLDLANAELWIDDGVNLPSQLTLGKILTTTGINRIPIK